jgi:hypothetical protein
MITESRKNEHTDMKTLEGIPWLKGFWNLLTRDDMLKKDYKYLKELEEWHKKWGKEGDKSSDNGN